MTGLSSNVETLSLTAARGSKKKKKKKKLSACRGEGSVVGLQQ
jgi:hypothetical protein